MITAVVFDWYGTLARFDGAARSGYAAVFDAHGHPIEDAAVDEYHARWDGIDHREHSVDAATYRAWARSRVEGFVRERAVADSGVVALVDALVASDATAAMTTFPEVRPVLRELRARGFSIGLCSNWGWDLDPVLVATGVEDLFEVAVTSARAGYRKPHPGIYAIVLDALSVRADEVLFVGDSFGPDVLGPIAAGMTAVHVRRETATGPVPALVEGASRVTSLEGLLDLGQLRGRR